MNYIKFKNLLNVWINFFKKACKAHRSVLNGFVLWWELTRSLHLNSQRPTPPLAPALEEDEADRSCGPTGFWEALTPCNGCRNLGFSSPSQVHTHTNCFVRTQWVLYNIILISLHNQHIKLTNGWRVTHGFTAVKLQVSDAAIVLSEFFNWLPWERMQWMSHH